MAKMNTRSLTGILVLIGFLDAAGAATAANIQYNITVTNLVGDTKAQGECTGQQMGLFLFATHGAGVKLFTLGESASGGLATLAESGSPFPLAKELQELHGEGVHVVTVPPLERFPADFRQGVLCPGESRTVTIDAPSGFQRLSMAAMVFPTNDGFIVLNGVRLPRGDQVLEFFSPVYDAGSELNDELCVNIPDLPPNPEPPPPLFPPLDEAGNICLPGDRNSNPLVSDPHPAAGEGYVHIHTGVHGIGDLPAKDWDWRNPVAQIIIRRASASEDRAGD
ncbi:MAG: spondin domain-containing protein [Pyrinomonadaceae bacterium]